MAGFGLTDTSTNLQGAINGEVFEYTQMYPAYIAVAEMQDEKVALSAMRLPLKQKNPRGTLRPGKEAVDAGKDLEADVVLLCPVCGFISLPAKKTNAPFAKQKREIHRILKGLSHVRSAPIDGPHGGLLQEEMIHA